jgi:hypothetical protein
MRYFTLLFILCSSLSIPQAHASIIKKPPSKIVDTPYRELVCTDQDRANIHELISIMAEKGKLSLLFQQNYLRELGAQINHVHPLKFLSVIFKDPHLKSCMYVIWNDYFKRTNFIDGLGKKLTQEHDKGKLEMHLPDFALDIGSSSDAIHSYVEMRDWENMVLFLIQS